GQDHATRAESVQLGRIDTGWSIPVFLERQRGRHQPAARTDDHRISAAESLPRAVVNRPHALGHGMVLQGNGRDARVTGAGALLFAVDLEVIARVRLEAEASVPVTGV